MRTEWIHYLHSKRQKQKALTRARLSFLESDITTDLVGVRQQRAELIREVWRLRARVAELSADLRVSQREIRQGRR